MKSHKKENRFKFVGFTTLIRSIHVDVVHQAKPYAATPDDAETFFARELSTQSDLNYSMDFGSFAEEISSLKLHTYPLLLHHQDAVVGALKKHLAVEGSLCLKSLLELTVAICRDLHEDFQRHLWDFFDILVYIMSGQKNAEVLESCFTTIAYLLKFSWRHLLNNMEEVFSHFEPLLSSHKEYIQRFASEAMAFFIHKSPAFDEVIKLCFADIERGALRADGFAVLLLQCFLGPRHYFHSSTPARLEEFLKYLRSYRGDYSVTSELLELVNGGLVSHASPLTSETIFDCLCKNGVISTDGSEAEKCYRSAWIGALSKWVSLKGGALLPAEKRLHLLEDVVLPLLHAADMDTATLGSIISLVASLFRSIDFQDNASSINSVLNTLAEVGPKLDHEALALLEETIDLTSYHLYFSSFLSRYLSKYLCNDITSNDRFLTCMCRLFCKHEAYFGAPLETSPKDGSSLWKKRFAQMKPMEATAYLISVIDYCAAGSSGELPLEWVPRLIGSCLVSATVLNMAGLNDRLLQIIMHLFNQDIFTSKEKAITLGTLIQCLPTSTSLAETMSCEVILANRKWLEWHYPFVLRVTDLYFSRLLVSGCSISASSLNTSLEPIFEGLLVPFHSVRVLVLSILRSLCCLAHFEEGAKLVELCSDAESIPLTIADYRDRLLKYRKAVTMFKEIDVPAELSNFRTLLLHFFAGQLRVNFSLLWSPILEHLEIAFRSIDENVAWPVLHRLLLEADEGTYNNLFELDLTLSFAENGSALGPFVSQYASLPTDFNSRIDATSFRYHIWALTERLSDVASSHTEVLSPLLISTFERELHATLLFGVDFDNLMEENHVDDTSEASFVNEPEVGDQVDFRTLIVMLEVFARFTDSSIVHESDSLRQLYMKLLLHDRNDVQNAALRCLFKYVSEEEIPTPYREKLIALLVDRTFRERLVLLGNDLQAEETDFDALLTILIRLLYGRIQGRKSACRKGQVFSFLARCRTAYVTMFVELTLTPIQGYLDPQTLADLLSGRCFSRSIPFYVMRITLQDLTDVVKRLGHRMEKSCQRTVLKMVLMLSTILERVCEAKSTVARYAFLRAKKLKKTAFGLLALFLRHFPEYPFISEELETLFEVALWPSLDREEQNVQIPVGLYSILLECSRSTYYWPLLVCKPHAGSYSPFSFLMRTLEYPSLLASTEVQILNIVFNLLTLADLCGMEESSALSNSPAFAEQHVFNKDACDPEMIVMSHVDSLVKYFTKKSSGRFLQDERILTILGRLGTKATTENDSLLLLLLHQIRGASRDEAMQAFLLESAMKLLRCTDRPSDYFDDIISLYACVNGRKAKALLSEAFHIVAAHDEDYCRLQAIVEGLDAWNQEQVEEPDYAVRLHNHKLARALLGEIPCHKLHVSLRVLTSCCFVELKSTPDLSLRNNALTTLVVGLSCLSTRRQQTDAIPLLTDLFLKQIKIGLKSKNDTVRRDMLALLRNCVMQFGHIRELSGLSQLLSEDDESDFFNNMGHIQARCQAKALRKLCDKLENPPEGFRPISASTLSSYILPLALAMLEDPLLRHKAYLEDVIRFIKCYCQVCPWRSYCSFLQHYLKLLAEEKDTPKRLTRIIVAIVDGFHFNVKGAGDGPTASGVSPTDRQSEEILYCISNSLLPKLKDALPAAGKEAWRGPGVLAVLDEKERIIRAPIALAIVKLLRKLPDEYLATELNSIILKVCNMLRSRSLDFRHFARKSLYSIARALGGRHLAAIIEDLKSLLSKGFQKHVLSFTVHGLLEALKNELTAADIDSCAKDIMELCQDELFGEIREERKNEAIIRSVWEVKFSKVFHTFNTLGELVSENSLPVVIEPLREVIRSNANHEAIQNVASALREFAIGLSKNERIPKEAKLTFAFQTLTDALPHTFEQRPLSDQADESEGRGPRSDCYLLPPEPGRRGFAPIYSKRSNFHLLVSFALEMLRSLLKGGKLPAREAKSCSLLDPFIEPLVGCLKTSYPSAVSKALRCLRSCVRYPLHSLKAAVPGIVNSIFDLLRKYVGLGSACRGESLEVLAGSFKLIAALIVHVDYFVLPDEEADVLLRYVEEDLADAQKHAIAFSVVKAVVARSYMARRLQPVVDKLKHLAIVASSDHIRDNCRLAITKYVKCALKERHLKGSQLRQMVEFFCVQLSYSVESGRISALEMTAWFIANLSVPSVTRLGSLLFLNLSARLVNDESERCKELSALALKSLIPKVTPELRKDIVTFVTDWVKSEQAAIKELGALCLGLLFEIGPGKGGTRKAALFSIALKEAKAMLAEKAQTTAPETLESRDRVVYLLLVACSKAVESFAPEDRLAELKKVRNRLLGVIDSALEYDHLWVMLAASKLLSSSMVLFGNPATSLGTGATASCGHKPSEDDVAILVSYCKKLFTHLANNKDSIPLAEQAAENLVYIAKCTPEYNDGPLPTDASEEADIPRLSLLWIAKRMARMCRFEVVSNPKSVMQRSYVFKWAAAVFLGCHKDCFDVLLDALLPPVFRECDVGDNDTLKTMAARVCDLLKEKVGLETFSEHWVRCRSFAAAKQMLRKQRLATQAITDPARAAKRKMHRHRSKTLSEKRRRLATSAPVEVPQDINRWSR